MAVSLVKILHCDLVKYHYYMDVWWVGTEPSRHTSLLGIVAFLALTMLTNQTSIL